MAEVDRIKVKIFNLLNKTVENGCSEHEALQAAEMAGRLMDKFQLEMSDIQIREQKCVQQDFPIGSKTRGPLDAVAVQLGRYCDVKIWFGRGKRSFAHGKVQKGEANYCVFGLESDCELFGFLLNVIRTACLQELAKFKKTDDYKNSYVKKTSSTTFYRYMASTIGNRLDEMKEDRVREAETTGRDLVLVKSEMINEEFSELGISLSKHQSQRRQHDFAAGHAGRVAGGKVNLNPGIGSNTKFGGYISG